MEYNLPVNQSYIAIEMSAETSCYKNTYCVDHHGAKESLGQQLCRLYTEFGMDQKHQPELCELECTMPGFLLVESCDQDALNVH